MNFKNLVYCQWLIRHKVQKQICHGIESLLTLLMLSFKMCEPPKHSLPTSQMNALWGGGDTFGHCCANQRLCDSEEGCEKPFFQPRLSSQSRFVHSRHPPTSLSSSDLQSFRPPPFSPLCATGGIPSPGATKAGKTEGGNQEEALFSLLLFWWWYGDVSLLLQ